MNEPTFDDMLLLTAKMKELGVKQFSTPEISVVFADPVPQFEPMENKTIIDPYE